jgi:hypothetical protein
LADQLQSLFFQWQKIAFQAGKRSEIVCRPNDFPGLGDFFFSFFLLVSNQLTHLANKIPMKFSARIGICCLAISIVLMQTACEENCKETLFELKEIQAMPRTLDASRSGNALWLNSAGLSVDRLLVKLELTKPVQVFFTPNPACPIVYENSNPVSELTLLSSEDFDQEHPAGTDLSDIIAFTDLKAYMSKDAFVEEILNGSNIGSYYFTFSKRPMETKMHSLVLEARLSDGKVIKTPAILVNLVP